METWKQSVARYSKSIRGFAAMELVMLIAAMGIATFVISGLMSLVAKSNKRSSDTSLILEIRNQINSINKNPEEWLAKMRGKYSLYAGCIPDAQTPRYIAGKFECPPLQNFQSLDTPLNDKLGVNYFASYAPVLGAQGEILAGTDVEPVYLNQSGKICEEDNAASTCPLKSTGFFARGTQILNQNPGNVRFIVKVERNLGALAKHSTIFKPEYFTIEVGTAWRDTNDAGAPAGSIKIGYLVDGTPNYINPAHTCPNGNVYIGANSAGSPICKAYPTDCGAKKSAALISVNAELVCSDNSSCKDNQVFLGHFAGTGEAICNVVDPIPCGANQLQVGLTASGAPNCVAINSCTNNEKLSYDGTSFSCQNDALAQSCPTGKIMVGLNSDGSLKCELKNTGLTVADLNCPEGSYVSGLEADGSVVCRSLAMASSSSSSESSASSVAAPRCTGTGWVNVNCFYPNAAATHRKVDGKWQAMNAAWTCAYWTNLCHSIGGVVTDIDKTDNQGTFRDSSNDDTGYRKNRREHSCACY